MKRLICLILSILLLTASSAPAFATETSSVLSTKEIDLGNGITMVEEIIEFPQARTTARTAVKRGTLKEGDTVVAVIEYQATFHYDYTTVTVASKSITRTDTYEGWNYKQSSFTSSGGTVTLTGKITKLLVLSHSFTLSLTCDAYGNIS